MSRHEQFRDFRRRLIPKTVETGFAPKSSALATVVPTVTLIIMDASQSMAKFKAATDSALKEFIETLKASELAPMIHAGVVVFDTHERILAPLQPVLEVVLAEYIPDGMTRLYGTVLDTMTALKEFVAVRPANVMISVFSDGDDNQSMHQQADLIRASAEARAAGWDLKATGFGIDGVELARKLGFQDDADHAVSVPADARSIIDAVRSTTSTTLSRTAFGLSQSGVRTRPPSHATGPISPPPSTPR